MLFRSPWQAVKPEGSAPQPAPAKASVFAFPPPQIQVPSAKPEVRSEPKVDHAAAPVPAPPAAPKPATGDAPAPDEARSAMSGWFSLSS